MAPVRHVSAWTESGDSASNTEQEIAHAALDAQVHHISGFEVVISGATASADIFVEIRSGARRLWKTCIGSGASRGERTGLSFAHPIPGDPGEDLTIYVDAGGAGCVTHGNMEGFTR